MRASDNSPPARFVPFLVSVSVPESKVSYGRQERTRPHLVPKQSGLLHCMQHCCMRQASPTFSAQEFPSRYPMVVNHHGIPSNPLRVSSGWLPQVLLIAVGSGPIPPWYYNASPGGGSESKMHPPHYFEIPLDGSVRFSSGSVLGYIMATCVQGPRIEPEPPNANKIRGRRSSNVIRSP